MGDVTHVTLRACVRARLPGSMGGCKSLCDAYHGQRLRPRANVSSLTFFFSLSKYGEFIRG